MEKAWLVYCIGTYGDSDSLETCCLSEEDADVYIAIHKKYYPVLKYRKEEICITDAKSLIRMIESYEKSK